MRTTLTLDDRVAKTLKSLAHNSGKPFKQVVDEILRAGLNARATPSPRPYRLKPVSLGGVAPEVDLNKVLRLAAALEDEEIARKLELRK